MCGTGFEHISKELFGNVQSIMLSIFFPMRLECVDNWATPASGITRGAIAAGHTLYPYFAITYAQDFRAEMGRVVSGGKPAPSNDRIGALKSRRSWPEYLRYCHLCARDDISAYGEPYWHRSHQLEGAAYCLKHEARLADSKVPVSSTKYHFRPASGEPYLTYPDDAPDVLAEYRDKFLKVGRESAWLLEHGLSVDWRVNGCEKYWRALRERGLASVTGIPDYKALGEAFFAHWNKDFLDALFSGSPDFEGWLHQIHKVNMRTFKPLHHILLMCFLKETVKEFVEYEPSDSPFGKSPFPCENPICSHYRIGGAENIAIRYDYNGAATGYFHCASCGMRYKISKSKAMKGIVVITDYGHLWKNELIRCSQDRAITNEMAADILKCEVHVMMLQKKKLGLLRPYHYDFEVGPEKYFKDQVEALCEKYSEVTRSLLNEHAPGAHDYLIRHDKEWLRSRTVFENERLCHRERQGQMFLKVKRAIEEIETNGNVERQVTFGYIAAVAGVTRDALRFTGNPKLHSLLDSVVESKEAWLRRRIVLAYQRRSKTGKPFSLADLKRDLMVARNTYQKYRELIEQLIDELNTTGKTAASDD